MEVGSFIREKRMSFLAKDKKYSLRQVAMRIGIEPSYLSKIERGEKVHLSEPKIKALADEIEEDHDVLLALCGKVSTDLLKVIRARPKLFAALIRELKDVPEASVDRLIQEVRDGKW